MFADVVSKAIDGIAPIEVFNKGIVRDGDGWIYDIDKDRENKQNTALHSLAAAVKTAILPISVPVQDHMVTPVEENLYWGHLSLAGHEVVADPTNTAEIGKFLLDLPIEKAPTEFIADTVSLFAFHADWTADWWRHMTWQHLRSWELSA